MDFDRYKSITLIRYIILIQEKIYLVTNVNYILMEEHFISIDGNKVRYLVSGRSKKIIVLIHGLGASAERWESVMPILEKKYQLIVPDLLGFGHSEKPLVDYTPEFFIDFLEKFLEKLRIAKCHMIGSSLGGQISAEFTVKNPQIIDKLILVSSSGIMKHSTPALDAYVMAALYPDKENAQNAFKTMSASKNVNFKIVDSFIERMHLPNAKMAFMSTILGLKNSEVITTKLEMITAPTLIVWGSLDPVIPIKYAKAFVSSIKDCRFYKMDNVGHTPFVDKPKEFAEIVLDFLK